MDIDIAREVVANYLSVSLKEQDVLNSPKAVRDFLRAHFVGLEHEVFVVLFLDAQNRLIEAVNLFRGSLTQTSVYPREIVKEALKRNAASTVFAPKSLSQTTNTTTSGRSRARRSNHRSS